MKFKVVDDGRVKGIIFTAESLLQLQEEIRKTDFSSDERIGAEAIYTFLKECYDKAHNKPKKSWW